MFTTNESTILLDGKSVAFCTDANLAGLFARAANFIGKLDALYSDGKPNGKTNGDAKRTRTEKGPRRCGTCGQSGHNRATCPKLGESWQEG